MRSVRRSDRRCCGAGSGERLGHLRRARTRSAHPHSCRKNAIPRWETPERPAGPRGEDRAGRQSMSRRTPASDAVDSVLPDGVVGDRMWKWTAAAAVIPPPLWSPCGEGGSIAQHDQLTAVRTANALLGHLKGTFLVNFALRRRLPSRENSETINPYALRHLSIQPLYRA
jgi:hypothetical protein